MFVYRVSPSWGIVGCRVVCVVHLFLGQGATLGDRLYFVCFRSAFSDGDLNFGFRVDRTAVALGVNDLVRNPLAAGGVVVTGSLFGAAPALLRGGGDGGGCGSLINPVAVVSFNRGRFG